MQMWWRKPRQAPPGPGSAAPAPNSGKVGRIEGARQVPAAKSAISFAEYQLFFQSAETVTERRLALNRFNYSVSAAIVLAIAVIGNEGIKETRTRFVAWCLSLAFSAMAVIFCTYWIRQIEDYKNLNNVKFQVLNDMARDSIFVDAEGRQICSSFQPFEKEWTILGAKKSVIELPGRGGLKVLKGSRAEIFVPNCFRALFALAFAATLVFGAFARESLVQDVNPFQNSAVEKGQTKPSQTTHPTQSVQGPTPNGLPSGPRQTFDQSGIRK